MAGARPLTVLLVEDEPLIGMTLVDMLEELGHRAIEAFAAEQAIEAFDQNPGIDLLITDLGLPDCPGDVLASRLREKDPHLPVIYASGAAPPAHAGLPGAEHLGKPFRLEDLSNTIGRVMAARAA